MDRPTCKTCPYWRSDLDNEEQPWGECRRHAPRPEFSAVDEQRTYLVELEIPARECDDWCGEHPDFPDYIAEIRRQKRAAAMTNPELNLERFLRKSP